MHFKPSAGIFVAGLATSVAGAIFAAMSMGMARTSSSGASMLALAGIAAAVAGLIMMCMGASRALKIIDTLPAAFRSLGQGQPTHQAPPAQHSYTPQHHEYGQQPPVQ